SYRKIARQVSTPDSAPAGLGSPQAGIGGLQQHQQQQQQQQAQQPLHQPDPMQQAKDNLNPAASQQTAVLRNGNPPPPVVSMLPLASSMHLLHVSWRKGKRRRHERVVKGRQVEEQPPEHLYVLAAVAATMGLWCSEGADGSASDDGGSGGGGKGS
ncbi:hypothetical protein M0802_014057, partial [Mischocyttarus mexicanus]